MKWHETKPFSLQLSANCDTVHSGLIEINRHEEDKKSVCHSANQRSIHRQCLSALVTQSDMSKYPSLVDWGWSQSGAAVTAQRGQVEDQTMCYYFPPKLITANQRRLGLKDNRMITCDRKPFTSHPGHLSFRSNQESRENNKGDWCYQHQSDYSPFNLIILYYEKRKDRKRWKKNLSKRLMI